MDLRTEAHDFTSAWRALSGSQGEEGGWRTIPITTSLPCRLLAARHFPTSEEAILVGLREVGAIQEDRLPKGRGFVVRQVDLGPSNSDCTWLALLRQQTGSLEIFTMMTSDIVGNLESSSHLNPEDLLARLLGRIAAWQDFMQRSRSGVLSPDAEVGLHGELVVLATLMRSGCSAEAALDGWRGPQNGLHDFRLGVGAIEVKATASAGSFAANVSSLDQLDETLADPLYLAAIRFRLDPLGMTLADRVAHLRETIGAHATDALIAFDLLLMQYGYHQSMADRYARRLSTRDERALRVTGDFPRLTRRCVPQGVIDARYTVDLDRTDLDSRSLAQVIESLLGEVI